MTLWLLEEDLGVWHVQRLVWKAVQWLTYLLSMSPTLACNHLDQLTTLFNLKIIWSRFRKVIKWKLDFNIGKYPYYLCNWDIINLMLWLQPSSGYNTPLHKLKGYLTIETGTWYVIHATDSTSQDILKSQELVMVFEMIYCECCYHLLINW